MLTGTTILLSITLIYATVTDLRSRKIPNLLTLPALAGGLILNSFVSGQAGLLQSLAGAGIALAIFIIPFIFNWVGAGDVKLVMAIGALMGPGYLITALLFTSLIAGVFAGVEIFRRRQAIATLQFLMMCWYVPMPAGATVLKARLPHAPAIALGCVLAWALSSLNIFQWGGS